MNPVRSLALANPLATIVSMPVSVALMVAAMASGSATLAAPDRSKPPAAKAVRPLALPAAERFTLSNGLPVVLVGLHEVPVVEVVLIVRAGAIADPSGRDGLAFLTADLLDEGAAGKDALALADAVDFLGATLRTGASWDVSTVRLRVPVARLKAALPLMSDVSQRPDFAEKELVRLRKEALTDLLQARDETGDIAALAIAQAVFGKDRRYGRAETGDATSLAAITIADVRAFHAARYNPGSAILVVVGDVTGASARADLDAAFGKWAAVPGASSAAPSVPKQVKGRSLWLVDKPGAAQSSIRIGRIGPSWSDPQYARNEVMNTLLGGSFTSRLNDNLREQHGYTYGARSTFERYRTGGIFLAAADVQTDMTAPAVTEFFRELDRIRTPAAPDEVERARNYAALGYSGEFETTQQVARRIAEKVIYDLPDDFFASFVPKALAVDAKTLEQAARATIDPSAVAIVVVGDRATIEAPLRALKLGSMRTLTLDEVMGPAPKIE